MDAFRCIHVSRLLLDHQLRVQGPFSPAIQKVVADATFATWERVIDQAQHHDVHCVLISGDCIEPHDRGLRGPAALVRGISRLAESEIAVLLHSSPRIWTDWPTGLRWPQYAHRLGVGTETEVPILRDGTLLAQVSVAGSDECHPNWRIRRPGHEPAEREFPLPNKIGPAIGIDCTETGAHGAMLYEFSCDAGMQQCFLPVAPVRWERCTAFANCDTARDDLLRELASQLEGVPASPGEQVRFVTWEISGTGQTIKSLSDPKFREEFLIDLELLDPIPGVVVQTHAFRMMGLDPLRRPDMPADDLQSEFSVRLENLLADSRAVRQKCLTGSSVLGCPGYLNLDRLLDEFRPTELNDEACLLATRWFSAEEEE